MLIGSRQKLSTLSESLELSIDNVPIKQVFTTKSLGILIDDNMAWHSHIGKLSKKIASSIGAIKRIKPFVSPEILHYIYNALVQPHFDYCSIVWGNCGKTLSEKLQKLQNRAARILTSSSTYDDDAGYLLQQLGWKDPIAQRQNQVALMVFKALNDLVPDYLRLQPDAALWFSRNFEKHVACIHRMASLYEARNQIQKSKPVLKRYSFPENEATF